MWTLIENFLLPSDISLLIGCRPKLLAGCCWPRIPGGNTGLPVGGNTSRVVRPPGGQYCLLPLLQQYCRNQQRGTKTSLQMSHNPSAWREQSTASEAGPKGYQQEVKTQKAFKISERLNICKADGREKRPESRSAFGVRKVGRCPESLWWKVFPWSAYQRSH